MTMFRASRTGPTRLGRLFAGVTTTAVLGLLLGACAATNPTDPPSSSSTTADVTSTASATPKPTGTFSTAMCTRYQKYEETIVELATEANESPDPKRPYGNMEGQMQAAIDFYDDARSLSPASDLWWIDGAQQIYRELYNEVRESPDTFMKKSEELLGDLEDKYELPLEKLANTCGESELLN